MHLTTTRPTQPGWYWHRYAKEGNNYVAPARVLFIGGKLHWNGWSPWELCESELDNWDDLTTADPKDLWSDEPIALPEGVFVIGAVPAPPPFRHMRGSYTPKRKLHQMEN